MDLAQVLRHLPRIQDDRLIVGLETSDDAGVIRLDDDHCLIQTLDFFTPIVDDPYDYGAMCTRNEALRAAVALVIRDARTDTSLADDAQHIHRHLDEGIRRRL